MRWHKAALLLASVITLSFAKEKPLSHPMTSCERLYAGQRFSGNEALRYKKMQAAAKRIVNNSTLELLWDGMMEHTAGALFRTTSIAAGYNPASLKLQWYPSNKDAPVISLHKMTVRVTLAPKIHLRLTSSAAASPACDDFKSYYEDAKVLRECDFLMPGKTKSIAYILNEWKGALQGEAVRSWAFKSSLWELEYIERSRVTHFINESNHSFLFLDADLWSNSTGVRVTQCVCHPMFCGEQANDTVSLRVYDPFLPVAVPFQGFIAAFAPSLSVLLNVIEFGTQNHSTIEERACEWASNNFLNNYLSTDRDPINMYKAYDHQQPTEAIVIIVCEAEKKDLDEYLYFTNTMRVSNNKSIQLFSTDCRETHWLVNTLLYWSECNLLRHKAGVILSNEMATVVAPIVENYELPLMTYDMSIGPNDETWRWPAVRSATGRVAHLGLSLRRLLADCGWRRLAIVSESTRLATALSAALRVPAAGLTVREVNVTSAPEIRSALQDFLAAGARVFLVNTDAAAAAVVLATALKLNITRDAGFVWIVREYGAADKATAATRPLSVSFSWRGDVADEASNSTLLAKLELRWKGRAWPQHAAPLVDAILTLQRIKRFEKNWFGLHEKGTTKIFWDGVQKTDISGIKQKLLYDEQGVTNPIVYVGQWGAATRPRLLAKWHVDQWRESAQCPMADPPPSDGFVRCLVPAGDAFLPTCRDTIWLTSAISAILLTAMLIFFAIRHSRRAIAARDQRIKAKVAERMLARRERIFSALAAHLVDRSTLKLHQELGTGRFGVVRLGVLRKPGRTQETIVVAAKALRDDASAAEESEFLREACTLAALDHQHVVRFVGVCVLDGPPQLLMEHASFGDLLHYLKSRRYLAEGAASAETSECTEFGFEEKVFVSAEALTKFAQEAAAALAYIVQRGFVHRDIRAANCLVDERRSLKLADFGLARATGTVDGEYMCNRRGMFPVLWMAPESLESGVSSWASDVWSFGVLVFELVTLGRRPYGSQPPPSVLRHVLGGGQPRLPWDASEATLSLVRACWRRAPEARPTAVQLAEWLTARRTALRPALSAELVEIL